MFENRFDRCSKGLNLAMRISYIPAIKTFYKVVNEYKQNKFNVVDYFTAATDFIYHSEINQIEDTYQKRYLSIPEFFIKFKIYNLSWWPESFINYKIGILTI